MDKIDLENLESIERVILEKNPFKLVSREFQREDTVIKVRDVEIGKAITVIAGPCAVENEKQTIDIAVAVKNSGGKMLRGGAFKPRTSLYSFQGLGEAGLKILSKARKKTGLPIVTEVLSPDKVKLVSKYADVLQVGCRNMQNFSLLQAVGKSGKPVLLKRGFTATIQEFLLSAECIMAEGNPNIILCERGIRTFETMTRNTLDLSVIPLVKKLSHLPIIVDPSHATGKKELVAPMSKAAIAAGADGIIVDVHPNPEKSLVDGPQALLPEDFQKLMGELRLIAEAVGRKI